MKINWKLRLLNKTTLVSLLTLGVGFVYQILALIGAVPKISENEVMNMVLLLVNLLTTFGVVIDPTTKGMSDSKSAMNFIEPKDKESEE